MMPYVLNLGWLWVGDNLMFILPMMTLPIALNIVHRIWKYTPSKIYNKFFGEMGLLHVVFTTMLIVGYLL